jgi:hypothetical protein
MSGSIQMRVRLTKRAHKAIAEAQRALGLARFEDALGCYVEGCIVSMKPASVEDRMRLGYGRKGRR